MAESFDRDELMDRVDGDAGFLAESIEMLDEDAGPLLKRVREAAGAGDAEGLAKAAHTLKGMLSNFCAEQATGAARELETRGREKRLEGIEAMIGDAERETERLRAELRVFLEALRS